MFDESKHPRADDGKFTDGNGGTKSEKLKEAEQVYNSEPAITLLEQQPSLEEVLGKEYKGYKGQSAIDKLMNEKQGHVKGAFHRDDIGDIDLLWGNEYLGLKHIILQREKQGIDTQQFMKDIADVVESGNFRKKNDRGNFEFMQNGKVAVISPEIRGNKITFLLTAFKTHSKK